MTREDKNLGAYDALPQSASNVRAGNGNVAYGTRIRTLYEYSQSGTIVRPRKDEVRMPDWYIVNFDGAGRGCVHRSMMALANEQ